MVKRYNGTALQRQLNKRWQPSKLTHLDFYAMAFLAGVILSATTW